MKPEPIARPDMVPWYHPGQLFQTGIQTLLSVVFAQRADYRLLEALGTPQLPFRYDDRREIWIDYVADIGDGFNSTYAVARQLARPSIELDGETLPRGSVLILGGDQVYPTPTRRGYRERFTAPYGNALPEDAVAERPDLYAIPGNHDWYDGLARFMSTFCHGEGVGAWRTPQKRSYFALRLAHRYWLLGVDIQLGSDIDLPQIDYFLGLDIQPGDRAVLCTAEPAWIFGNVYDPRLKRNLADLKSRLEARGVEVTLQIAGDLHHYRRHQRLKGKAPPDATAPLGDAHLITCGGGGAFLHPTHTHAVKRIQVGEGKGSHFALQKEYPERGVSRRLGVRNLGFLYYNPYFGIVTAIAYVLLSFVMPAPEYHPDHPILRMLLAGIEKVSAHASSFGVLAAILIAFIAFTDTHRRWYRVVAGLLHGGTHLFAALLVAGLANNEIAPRLGAWARGTDAMQHLVQDHAWFAASLSQLGERLVLVLCAAAGGYVLGSLIMGAYLTLSVCVFNRHFNEAFSSLRIEGFNSFLRMKLDPTGLKVWAIGLEKVPAEWEWRSDPPTAPPAWHPTPGNDTSPHLIEKIAIPHASRAPSVRPPPGPPAADPNQN